MLSVIIHQKISSIVNTNPLTTGNSKGILNNVALTSFYCAVTSNCTSMLPRVALE